MPKKIVAPLKPDNNISGKDKFYLTVIVLVVLAAFILMMVNGTKEKKIDQNQVQNNIASTSTKPSIEAIVDKVSSLIFNQNTEKPMVVTIVNIDELQSKDPMFYKDAQNGDKILIWTEKIALYSSSADKLISVLPRALWDQQNTEPATSTQSVKPLTIDEKATITVKNGTSKIGLAKTIGDLLLQSGLDVVKTGDAKSKNYVQTQIIRLTSESYPKTEEVLKKDLKVEVTQGIPANYSDKTDYIVIVGADLVPAE